MTTYTSCFIVIWIWTTTAETWNANSHAVYVLCSNPLPKLSNSTNKNIITDAKSHRCMDLLPEVKHKHTAWIFLGKTVYCLYYYELSYF